MKTSRTRYRTEMNPYTSNEYFRHGRITRIKCTLCYNLIHLYVAVLIWLYSILTSPAGSKPTLIALGSNGLYSQPKQFLLLSDYQVMASRMRKLHSYFSIKIPPWSLVTSHTGITTGAGGGRGQARLGAQGKSTFSSNSLKLCFKK